MHRKIKSRARQARRDQTDALAVAKKKDDLIRQLNRAHRSEVYRLYAIIRDQNWKLADAISALLKETESLKRMLHGYAVIGANAKPQD